MENTATFPIGSPPGVRAQVNLAYLIPICLVATLGGLLFGYDTGVISGAIEPLTARFGLSDFMKGWTSGCVLMGCATGVLAVGPLSDRFGRRTLLIWPRLAFLLATLPVFMLVTHNRSASVLLGLMGGLNILANLSGVPALVAITESLRKEIRGVGVATIYAVAVCIFGGTTQPIIAWLGEVTHNPLAIAYYLMAGTAVALVASLLMIETVLPREHRAR